MMLIEAARSFLDRPFHLGQAGAAVDCFGLALLAGQAVGAIPPEVQRSAFPLGGPPWMARKTLLEWFEETEGEEGVAVMRVPRASTGCHIGVIGGGRIISASAIHGRVVETGLDDRLRRLIFWKGAIRG